MLGSMQALILPDIWNLEKPTFAQAWEKSDSNADKIYVLEKVLSVAKTKNQLQGIEWYINETPILPYLKKELMDKVAKIKAKL